ncbi:hypothetical protein VNO77_41220 [Canavalia gladiata]|uniref:Uncharacterized protein n=1 Tax=Canavalia gladiata TaxID=3824 RepID=A0AAN9PSE3_CANGL
MRAVRDNFAIWIAKAQSIQQVPLSKRVNRSKYSATEFKFWIVGRYSLMPHGSHRNETNKMRKPMVISILCNCKASTLNCFTLQGRTANLPFSS